MVASNLYPPLIDTYQKAFITTHWVDYYPNTTRVYFALSPYNKISYSREEGAINPNYAQVTVRFQDSNKSFLNPRKKTYTLNDVHVTESERTSVTVYKPGYISEIKLCQIKVDDTIKDSDYRYYIELSEADFAYMPVPLNKYFKVQIRFTEWGAESIPKWEALNYSYPYKTTDALYDWNEIPKWINDNKDYFSEWSTVTLIRRIAKPSVTQSVFENLPGALYTGYYRSTTLEFMGKVDFNEAAETETIDSYILNLFEKGKDGKFKSIKRTPWISADEYNNTNEIRYTFSEELEDGKQYRLYIKFKTKNGYESQNPSQEPEHSGDQHRPADTIFSYTFTVALQDKDKVRCEIVSEPDAQRGSIKVITKEAQPYNGYLMYRRASSRSNFTQWEDIYMIYVDTEENLLQEYSDYGETWDEIKYLQKDTDYIPAAIIRTEDFVHDFYWYDCTIESGVFYKYGIQKIYLDAEEN